MLWAGPNLIQQQPGADNARVPQADLNMIRPQPEANNADRVPQADLNVIRPQPEANNAQVLPEVEVAQAEQARNDAQVERGVPPVNIDQPEAQQADNSNAPNNNG